MQSDKPIRPVLHDWVWQLPMMQQTVLLTAIRGPDGVTKYGAHKLLLRWYRRCILLSAMDGKVLNNPCDLNGGSFTGPSLPKYPPNDHLAEQNDHWEPAMDAIVDDYMRSLDALPMHFHLHLIHAVEILGYKHPVERIRLWWAKLYIRFVNDMHLSPETCAEMDARLGDSRQGWLDRADPATAQ